MPASVRTLKRTVKLVLRVARSEWCTANRITRDLQTLGVRRGGTLMVHSSLASLGYVPGGPETVIKALLAALGPQGTLVMPSHSWAQSGRGDFRFDVNQTPSCVGRISDVFRRQPEVRRSLHPTHAVSALGPRAAYLVEGHEHAPTPCGRATPYEKLIDERCQILFLGATLDQNTIFHTLEAFEDLPYLMRDDDESFTITTADGTTRVMEFRRHHRGPDRRFAATQDLLESAGVLWKGKVGASRSLLVECAPMVDVIVEMLRKDPNFLVE